MLEVGGLSESRALPPSWVRLELEELEETHSAYPALSALEKDSYMSDMIALLSNFKFGWLKICLVRAEHFPPSQIRVW